MIALTIVDTQITYQFVTGLIVDHFGDCTNTKIATKQGGCLKKCAPFGIGKRSSHRPAIKLDNVYIKRAQIFEVGSPGTKVIKTDSMLRIGPIRFLAVSIMILKDLTSYISVSILRIV